MFSTRGVTLFLIAALLLAVSPVFAGGGGGTKRNGNILFTDNTTGPAVNVGVTPNGTNAAILAATTPAAFTAAGGRILNPSVSTEFSVLAGTYTVLAVDPANGPFTKTVTVVKGQTTTVSVGGTTGALTLTVSP